MMNYEELYREALEEAQKRVSKAPGIALGFHSVTDGLVFTDENKLEELLKEHGIEECDEIPTSIKTPEDFLKGYLCAFESGKAIQIMIDDENVKDWIEREFGWGKLRLGGTSANMASALAIFGFPKVLVYAYPLTRELASLFPDLPNLFTVSESGEIGHPRKCWKGEGVKALHWIFEFKEGQKILGKTCPRSNRFIASWNPVNSKLKIGEWFRKYYLEHTDEFPKFILAGFHIMREVYPDGEKVEERFEEICSFLEEVREKGVEVHVEMASVRSQRIRKLILERVLPKVSSFGMNEVELSWIAQDIGEDPHGVADGDVESVERVLRKIADTTGIDRIHFHTLGYYAVLSKNAESEAKSLAITALAAAVRAERGEFVSWKDLEDGMKHPISEFGIESAKRSKEDFFVLPTRIVKSPRLTVGLGDTISSIAFALR